ncbi:hypothetical protein CLIM01_13581 [Colletotrichum limetticola]|uniref:Uncharacterized protein n=1 Tax=Colletotrichum limetticola TaxID=1209924 RepID=A0ABQ9PDY8_9PEZI|nr:hypothetical protein CLIM01_13581 [Colletotrichum limetticola]
MSGCAGLSIERSGPQIVFSNILSNHGSESDSEGLADAVETRLSGLRNVAVASGDHSHDGLVMSGAGNDQAAEYESAVCDESAAAAEVAGNDVNAQPISGRNVRIDPFESLGDASKAASPKHALKKNVGDDNIGHKKGAATLKSTAKRGRGGCASGPRFP